MKQTCCICFPLDCGVKVVCCWTILVSIGSFIQCSVEPEYIGIFMPYAISSAILSIVWIKAWVFPTNSGRQAVLVTFIACSLLFNQGYHAYQLIRGQLQEYQCRPEELRHLNHDISEIKRETSLDLGQVISTEECVARISPWLWADFAFWLVFSLYFTFVLMRWAK